MDVAGRRSHIVIAAALALSALGAAGCEAITGPSDEERRIAAEQVVIKAYSDEVPKVDALLSTFLEAWKKANEKKDLKAYKDDIQANVLPALDKFVAAAEAMPVGSERLKAIHAPLVAAYKGAQTAHKAFLEGVSEATMDAEYARVLTAMDAVTKAEDAYLTSLTAYYKEHRVDLQKGP